MLTYSSSYSRYTIPAGTYKGQDEDINTIGVKSVLITSDSISEANKHANALQEIKKNSVFSIPGSLVDEKFAALTTLQFLFIQCRIAIKKKELI